jgi:peptidyl-prolyl cis-trans isomerase C
LIFKVHEKETKMEIKRVFVIVLVAVVLFFSMGSEAKTAAASHILVKTEKLALDLKQKINEGAEFSEMAKSHSTCPSKAKGGALGTFRPGDMVPEFNDAVFNPENKVGDVIGPVKTQFGYHLIMVTDRKE